jgi:hypothetical protein
MLWRKRQIEEALRGWIGLEFSLHELRVLVAFDCMFEFNDPQGI